MFSLKLGVPGFLLAKSAFGAARASGEVGSKLAMPNPMLILLLRLSSSYWAEN